MSASDLTVCLAAILVAIPLCPALMALTYWLLSKRDVFRVHAIVAAKARRHAEREQRLGAL